MKLIKQYPAGGIHLCWAGDFFEIRLEVTPTQAGRAVFRTNLGNAGIRRRALIANSDNQGAAWACDWHDIPMTATAPGIYTARLPLLEVGLFEGKCCFFAADSHLPEWPQGENLRIKVEPAHTAAQNTVYTAFVRQYGAALQNNPRHGALQEQEAALDQLGYIVIPPSGTFRALAKKLDAIMDEMGFRIIQLLPVHPVPVSFGRMGRFGSAFAALDFFSVDPALAEFDTRATPLDQFRELIEEVHRRDGYLYMDLPANHTGWAATMQLHHPEWYHRKADGEFVSPGAWGVVWADLVELDYSDPTLCAYMADVFLFWCRQGVDGFRCDAGYMIPATTWNYIVARVREEYPDTVFLLEGLGGKVEVTEQLLIESNLNWAYSELFQTEDRGALEWYLPRAIKLAESCGPLIHFAETHDNNRLAARGKTYARMRVALAALCSHQGAFGITNGVEWFAREKVDVHGASALDWGAAENQRTRIYELNQLLASHPCFGAHTRLRLVTSGSGTGIALLRAAPKENATLLVLVNLDCEQPQEIHWEAQSFAPGVVWDLLTHEAFALQHPQLKLAPGRAVCLTHNAADLSLLQSTPPDTTLAVRQRNLMALRIFTTLRQPAPNQAAVTSHEVDELGALMLRAPTLFCQTCATTDKQDPSTTLPRLTTWQWPVDLRRQVMLPPGNVLLVRAPSPFRVELKRELTTQSSTRALRFDDGTWGAFLIPEAYTAADGEAWAERRTLKIALYDSQQVTQKSAPILMLPPSGAAHILAGVTGARVRQEPNLCAILANPRGSMAQVRAAWGTLRSQYDCLLAVNPDPHVPADRMVFWTRCRAWLRYRGYSHEINDSCLDYFTSTPDGRSATWYFKVPSGMGRHISLNFHLALEPEHNCAHLSVTRRKNAPDNASAGTMQSMGQAQFLADDDEVTVILRPDIEWRSFHHKTKAFLGPEEAWPRAIQARRTGFSFNPDDAVHLQLEAHRAPHAQAPLAFHAEPEWLYMINHCEDHERGLDRHCDLFSPGWFKIGLNGGTSVTLSAGSECPPGSGQHPRTAVSDTHPATNDLAAIMTQALSLYIVHRDQLKTVIAGYPWFLDWGRDTLIALRGLIAGGRHDEALAILREFGRYEERGTLPNIIHGQTVGNRDTSDAPLWFCVASADLCAAIGEKKVLGAQCGQRKLREVLLSIVTHYRDGTPNGIKMDRASALIYSPSHFTWMDTNYPAASPRAGYPIDIQALWIAALQMVARTIDPRWQKLADRATHSIEQYFTTREGWLADCLRADADTPAAQAEVEDLLRPNQLFALTLGMALPPATKSAVLTACESLLVPGAIRSLADRPIRPELAAWPYRGQYLGDEDTQRKPAYHNGTAWTWPFPSYVEALYDLYGPAARTQGLALLGSAIELINRGCLGHPPEICDGDAPHLTRGCTAQAWGVSELLRVWLKLS